MKRQLFRVLLTTIALSMVLWLMGCGSAPQNSNQNANTGNANVSQTSILADSDDPCKTTDIGVKLDRLKTQLERKIDGDKNSNDNDAQKKDRLSYQYKRSFFLHFVVGTGSDTGYGVLYVEGAIQGEKKYKLLAEFVEDFIKKDCRLKVVFVPKGTFPRKVTPPPGGPEGFQWCEAPLVACPGGECRENCGIIPIATPSPGNSNSNTNSGSNGNSNTNANRPGNS